MGAIWPLNVIYISALGVFVRQSIVGPYDRRISPFQVTPGVTVAGVWLVTSLVWGLVWKQGQHSIFVIKRKKKKENLNSIFDTESKPYSENPALYFCN